MQSITLAIGDITVRNHNGLFSLNDLHKASGGNPGQRPGEFMRNQQTKELVEEISNAGISAFESRKGNNGGTYACRELVIAYAAWISAAFHLKVIRVFLSATAPQARPHNPAIDYDRISPAQAQDLKELVHAVVDAKVQGFAETWARLHRKFRVNSYLELPATKYQEARDYLLGKLPENSPPQMDAADGSALAAARNAAMEYLSAFRAAAVSGGPTPKMGDIPVNILEGIVADALMRQRMLVTFDQDTGRMQSRMVPADSSVISLEKGDYTGLVQKVPMQRLPELAEILNRRIASHLGAFSTMLQSSR